MAYTITGPYGELAEDGTDAKFFEFVLRHKFVGRVAGGAGVLPEPHEPGGITARDPQVRERIVAAKMSGDPMDAFAARFIELTQGALEHDASLTFCGD